MLRFAKEFFYYGLSRALAKLCGLLLLPLLARVLSKDDMGVLGVCTVLGSALAVLADLQIASAMGRFFHAEADEQGRKILVGTGLIAVSILSGVVMMLLLVLAPTLGPWVFGERPLLWVLAFVAIQTPFVAWNSYLLYVLRLASRPRAYLAVTSTITLLTTVVSVVLVLGLGWGLAGALVGQVSGVVAGFAVVCWQTSRSIGWAFDWRRFKELVSFGIPSVPAVAGSWLQNSVGVGVVLTYFSLEEVGVYSVALRIASAAALYQMSFGLAWFPYAMSVMRQPDHRDQYAAGMLCYVSFGVVVVAGLTLMAPEIVRLIAGPSYAEAAPLIGLLALAVVAEGMVIPGSLGIMIVKKTYYYSLGYAFSVLVNAVVMILLVPSHGILAVAGGLAAGRLSHAAFVYYVSQRLYPIPHYREVLALSLTGCGILVVLAPDLGGLSWLTRSACLIGIVLLLILPVRAVWPRLSAVFRTRST